jgi:hypothetical protein
LFEESYPQACAIRQARRNEPGWPYNTWRVVADPTKRHSEWIYLTTFSFATEDEALQAAEDGFMRAMKRKVENPW